MLKVKLCEVLLPWVLCESRVFPGRYPLEVLSGVEPLTWRSVLQGDWVVGQFILRLSYHPFLYWKSLHFQLPLLAPYHFFHKVLGGVPLCLAFGNTLGLGLGLGLPSTLSFSPV